MRSFCPKSLYKLLATSGSESVSGSLPAYSCRVHAVLAEENSRIAIQSLMPEGHSFLFDADSDTDPDPEVDKNAIASHPLTQAYEVL